MLPNGIEATRSYDAAARVDVIGYNHGAGTLDSFDYTYDLAGNRTALTSGAGTESYVLDDLNRLTTATYANGDITSYTYDSAGNRLTQTVSGSPIAYSYDAAGQLTAVGSDTPNYDPAGHLTALGSAAFTWDVYGRIATAADSTLSQSYAFDGDGLRTSITDSGGSTPLLWDRTGSLPMIVSDGDEWFIHGPAAVGEGGNGGSWLLPDGLGSTRLVTDATGGTTGSYAYDAFGTPRSASGPDPAFGYTGQWTDPTGLVYLRAWMYDPAVGRFLSRDRLQPNAPVTQGWNHYTYATNNPTTWIDPTGNGPASEYFSLGNAGIGAGIGFLTRGRCRRASGVQHSP